MILQPIQYKKFKTDFFFGTSESEISVDSNFTLQNETLYERIVALKDMIPPQSRRRIVSTVSSLTDATKTTFSFSGKALWIISTSAFLLGVPWALAFAEEEQYVQMEKEQGMMRGANEVSLDISLVFRHYFCTVINLSHRCSPPELTLPLLLSELGIPSKSPSLPCNQGQIYD